MSETFRIGDRVLLPAPFSRLTGVVRRIYRTGPNALITVEYPLDEGTDETLTMGFLASELRRAASPAA